MFLHTKHASPSSENTVIKSPDTDVFVITVALQQTMNCRIIFQTGSGYNLSNVCEHYMVTNAAELLLSIIILQADKYIQLSY